MTSLSENVPEPSPLARWRPKHKVLVAGVLGPVLLTVPALIATGFSPISLTAFLSSLITAAIAYLTPDPQPPVKLVDEPEPPVVIDPGPR